MTMRQQFKQGTWLDPEEYAYPAGSLRQSRRKAGALCADGKVRTFIAGIPDTYFSIPARGKMKGKSVSGYLTMETDSGTLKFKQSRRVGKAEILEAVKGVTIPKWVDGETLLPGDGKGK